MNWQLQLRIDQDSTVSLYLRIADALARAIVERGLKPGDALPSSRGLAGLLSVNRNTVIAAYDELFAQGWIRRDAGRGTFVADAPPYEILVQRSRFAERPIYSPGPRKHRRRDPLARDEIPPLQMGSGLPDLRLLPTELLGRAYSRVLRRDRRRRLSNYSDPRGHRNLRSQLATMLSRARGLALSVDEILITRGSQMALHLIALQLIRPGDRVVVETLGYEPAWQAFKNAGAQLHSVPVDQDGMQVGKLESLLKSTSIRAVYLTPHHQYPTTATLSANRRQLLLRLATRYRFAIIEDDYDNEIHYEGTPVLPLAAVDAGRSVIYVGGLSKIFAPHLRLGFLVAPQSIVDELARLRDTVDGGGDAVLECAVAELFEDDEILRHARRIKRIFRSRRERLLLELEENLSDWLVPKPARGGMALWAAVHGVDPEAWAQSAAHQGVQVSPGRLFRFDGRQSPHMRIGFAACNEDELIRGVQILKSALGDLR